MRTPETRRGWEQPRHPELTGEGCERQETRTEATVEGVRVEARRRKRAAGGVPGNVPAGQRSSAKVELRRVSVTVTDTDLGCERRHGIGFSWRCTCGAHGPVTQDRAAAAAGKRAHEAEHTISATPHREARSGSTELGHRRHAHRGEGEAGPAARDGEGRAEA